MDEVVIPAPDGGIVVQGCYRVEGLCHSKQAGRGPSRPGYYWYVTAGVRL